VRDAPAALAHCRAHVERELGDGGLEPATRLVEERDQARRLARDDRGRAPSGREQPDLAEAVAPPSTIA
jgi:hypothetical protein